MKSAQSEITYSGPRRSTRTGAGQSSEIYLVELEGSADAFRKEAKAAGLSYADLCVKILEDARLDDGGRE